MRRFTLSYLLVMVALVAILIGTGRMMVQSRSLELPPATIFFELALAWTGLSIGGLWDKPIWGASLALILGNLCFIGFYLFA